MDGNYYSDMVDDYEKKLAALRAENKKLLDVLQRFLNDCECDILPVRNDVRDAIDAAIDAEKEKS